MPTSGRTRLQILNLVLPRLRESTVANTSSTLYASLVSGLIDTVKTEIENAHQWLEMRDTYSVTATPNVSTYTLTGSGPSAKIMDGWDTTNGGELALGSFHDFNQKFFGVTSVSTGPVKQYLPAGLDSSFDLQVDVWPIPSATATLKFNIYTPQANLTVDSTVPLVPQDALIEGVIARAMAERGDDNGTQVQMQEGIYQRLLGDAVAAEMGGDPSEADWAVD